MPFNVSQVLLMKFAGVIAIVLIATRALHGEEPPAAPVELKSLHGTMVTMISETEGLPIEIWAQGDRMRSEISVGDQKIVTIQLGDTMYTFGPNLPQGNKTRFEAGLASLGLIKQIALVRAKGKKVGSQVIEGVAYDQYTYDADAPREVARVLLEAKTSLPKNWVSTVKNSAGESATVRIEYRDMEANVVVPDDLFALPPDADFTEVSAAELMATPIPRAGRKQSVAAELKSLHGTMVMNQKEDEPLEIWAKGDNVRAVYSGDKSKVINVQRGGTVFTYLEGSTTGSEKHLGTKLRSMGLIRQIEEVKANGKKVESLEIEGAMFDKYTYDLNAPAETAVAYLSSESSLPGLMIFTVVYGDKKESNVQQFRNMQANIDIPDNLFELPPNSTFSQRPTAKLMEPSEGSPKP